MFTLQEGWQGQLGRVAAPLLTGSLLLGLVSSAAGYAIARFIVNRYKKVRLEHQQPTIKLELL
jgi:hypothetical protein